MFGRKINNAENQLAFIEFLRHIADGVIEPVEAVRAYHAVLEKLSLAPNRSLEEDLTLQTAVMSYAGNGKTISLPPKKAFVAGLSQKKSTSQSTPDFSRMSSEERLEYHQNRLNRMFGQ